MVKSKVKETETAPAKEQRAVTNLSELGTHEVEFVIEVDDMILRIPGRTLSYGQWQRIEKDVPPAVPPGEPGRDGIQYNYNNPQYLLKLGERHTKVSLARVLHCLRIDGITGNTLEERLESLCDAVDAKVLIALMNAVHKLHEKYEARVEARASSFRNQ